MAFYFAPSADMNFNIFVNYYITLTL